MIQRWLDKLKLKLSYLAFPLNRNHSNYPKAEQDRSIYLYWKELLTSLDVLFKLVAKLVLIFRSLQLNLENSCIWGTKKIHQLAKEEEDFGID